MVTIPSDKIILSIMIIIFCIPLSYATCYDDCYENKEICYEDCDSDYDSCDLAESACQGILTSCEGACNGGFTSCYSSCGGDQDGDGHDDFNDTMIGDKGDVVLKGFGDVEIMIGSINSTDPGASTLSGIQDVTITADSTPIAEITVDFDNANIDVSHLEIKKQRIGELNGIVLKGLESSAPITKTLYMERYNPKGGICVADKEIDSIKEISQYCNGKDEYFFGRCYNGETINGVTCTVENNMFKISGLTHSGAVELNYTGLYTGFFTVEYTNVINAHRDGYVMPGEKVRICFESQRGIKDDEYLRFIFAPQYGQFSVKEIFTPEILTVYNVHLYP